MNQDWCEFGNQCRKFPKGQCHKNHSMKPPGTTDQISRADSTREGLDSKAPKEMNNLRKPRKQRQPQDLFSDTTTTISSYSQPQNRPEGREKKEHKLTKANLEALPQASNLKDKSNKDNLFTKKCKNGARCQKYMKGICTYIHDEDEPMDARQEQPSKRQQQQQPKMSQREQQTPQQYEKEPSPRLMSTRGKQPPIKQPKAQPAAEERKNEKVQQYSFSYLKSLSEKEPRDIIKDLFDQGDRVIDRLNGSKINDQIAASNVLIILEKVLEADQKEFGDQVALKFAESNIFQKLGAVLKDLQNKELKNVQERVDFFCNYIEVVHSLVLRVPKQAKNLNIEDITSSVILFGYNKRLLPDQQKFLKDSVDCLMKSYSDSLEREKELIEQAKFQAKNARKPVLKKKDESYLEGPVEDFKDIDVIPGDDQLRSLNQIKLRAMPEEGDLQTVHNYLDILFHLLHEDGIHDLKKGISFLINLNKRGLSKSEIKKKMREETIKQHEHLSIIGVTSIEGSSCVQFRLPTQKKRFVDWKISKRLLPGSLVVITPDYFETFLVGIVKNRDAQEMNYTHKKFGYVPINVEIVKSNSCMQSSIQIAMGYSQKEFLMIESPAYFEAYQHVLRQLQEMDNWDSIPFQRQIVRGKASSDIPTYVANLNQSHPGKIKAFIENLLLDPSQKQAMQHAVCNKLALIQGPPGTGKTYIGVQIVKFLIKFRDYWNREGPILLVTYSNHALNQFLNYVKEITTKIVRFGGKTDPELEQFGLREQLRKIPNKTFGKIYKKIKDAEADLQASQRLLAKYQIGIITTTLSKDECPDAYQIIGLLMDQYKNYEQKFFVGLEKDFSLFVDDKLKQLRSKTDWNIIVLIWLGIIDLGIYIREYLRPLFYELKNPFKEEEEEKKEDEEKGVLDDKQDYREEREKDYDIFKFAIDKGLDQLWSNLKESFKPGLTHQILREAESIQGCLSIGSDLEFKNDRIGESSVAMMRNCNDLFNKVSFEDKWRINNFIMRRLQTNQILQQGECIQQLKTNWELRKSIDAESVETLLQDIDIIAMTTTGRSKYNHLLKYIKIPIVIVEEAAEVFEAHIVTSFTQSTQHLILIGDHEQLRPNPAVYDLSLNFNLSMSMFERLIKNGIQHSTLLIQRRMRPEISKMMNFIYPDLQDHPIVKKYPDIKGLPQNLFFFDHSFKESENELMMSKTNVEEAQIIVRFAFFLLQQRYQAKQITILTLYTGQLLKIKELMKKLSADVNKSILDQHLYQKKGHLEQVKGFIDLLSIRVVNVDNYQGEENDIILLSLVRSNMHNQIGFLKITNRVCVALSRARMGLYIFGNSKCLAGSQIKLWLDVIRHLKETNAFSDTLKISCKTHKALAEIKKASDFDKVPEGGCNQKCMVPLVCGHPCTRHCHPFVRDEYLDPTGHKGAKCTQKCNLLRNCGHSCPKKCYECVEGHKNDCSVPIKFKLATCKHTIDIECSKANTNPKCIERCEKMLPCGHQCRDGCGQPCGQKRCNERVNQLLDCNHVIEKDCSQPLSELSCLALCQTKLQCGHPCEGKCGDCNRNKKHKGCPQKCGKMLICGHTCQENCNSWGCTMVCSSQYCNNRCKHGNCKNPCSEKCSVCLEPCVNMCKHSQCSKKCNEICDRIPCKEPCDKLLECEHQCQGLCGEKCPEVCRTCNPKHYIFKNHEEDKRFIQLECGHYFESQELDDHVLGFKKGEIKPVQYSACKTCKQPIKSLPRYLRHSNMVRNDMNVIKGHMQSQIKKLKESAQVLQVRIKSLFDSMQGRDHVIDHTKEILRLALQRIESILQSSKSISDFNEFLSHQAYISDITFVAQIWAREKGKLNYDMLAQINQLFELGDQRAQLQLQESESKKKKMSQLAAKLSITFGQDKREQLNEKPILDYKGDFYRCFEGHIFIARSSVKPDKCPTCK